MTELSMGEVVARTGVAEGTLRMWERRHGFPEPQRTASGHRRYSEHEVELIRRVAAGRQAGLSLATAIEHARRWPAQAGGSIFAALRQIRPDLEPRPIRKAILVAVSHAIEDESLAQAQRPLLFACFQRARFYRQEQPRWQQLAQSAVLAVVFADFKRLRTPRGGPAELPLAPDDPVTREWAIVCDAPGYTVCLVGREPPSSSVDAPSVRRAFEVIWSVEPAIVREAARICGALAQRSISLSEEVREWLRGEPMAPARDQLRLATAISTRALSYLG
jgi:MerR family transcriptional regulator, light-induced transcriptional regulator